jgi:hypothetical protein
MKYRLLLLFFFLSGCSNHKQTEITILKHQSIDLKEDYIGYGGFLALYQENIVGIDMSPSMQPFFCLKSNDSQNPFYYFGNRGRGPNEFLMPYSIQYINNQTVGVLDVRSGGYFEFKIPTENEGLAIDKKNFFQMPMTRIVKTAFNQYIGLSLGEKMFLLADSTGISINTFFEYPYKDKRERQLTNRSNAYQGTLAINPSKNKFVYSSFNGKIIHFYKIENNNIKLISKIEDEYPLYQKRNDEQGSIAFKREGKVGYIATYATDKYVYAIFSGKEILEQKSVNYEGGILHIFDWNGYLVKEYQLDILCSYLCVSEDDNKLWAITSDPDIMLVYFDLKNAKTNNQMTEMPKPNLEMPKPDLHKSKSIPRFTYQVISESGQNDKAEKMQDSIIKGLSKGPMNIQSDDIIDIRKDTIARDIIKVQIIIK